MELRVSAAQLLLSELLLLPAVGLERRVEVELAGNAALELPAVPSCPGCGQRSGPAPACAATGGRRASRRRAIRRTGTATGTGTATAGRAAGAGEQVLLDAAPALHPGEPGGRRAPAGRRRRRRAAGRAGGGGGRAARGDRADRAPGDRGAAGVGDTRPVRRTLAERLRL